MPEPKNKKIGDHVFPISQPYEEGHTLTAIEAKVLNQVRAENIGNNVRKKVQELLAEGKTAEAEALVAEKDREYQFTEAAAGGSSRTMVPAETPRNSGCARVHGVLAAGEPARAEVLVVGKGRQCEFSAAAAGGCSRTMPPSETEARKLGRDAIKGAPAAECHKLADIDKE